MPDSTDALLEIVHELAATHQLRLAPATLPTVRDIFEQTVGGFARDVVDAAPDAHPWENDDFRAFILGQVRRIADEARRHAGDQAVAPEVFRQAATDVMRRTHQVCRLAAERGRLTFVTAAVPEHHEGQVCSIYLRNLES